MATAAVEKSWVEKGWFYAAPAVLNSLKEVLDKGKIIRIETEKKRLTDAVKMACYRAETQMYEAVGHHAAFARNLDEGRSFLQRIFQQPADIIPNHDENQLEVRFHTMSTLRGNNALQKICDVVNEKKMSYPDTT